MFGTGLVVSWIYLRFYQPPVSVLSNTVFSLLVKCRVCKKPVRRYDVGAPAGITISLPGAESQDAERRRQIALRALSERLSKSEASQSQWPSMEEPEKGDSPTNLSVETASVDSVDSVSVTPSPTPQTAQTQDTETPEVVVQL